MLCHPLWLCGPVVMALVSMGPRVDVPFLRPDELNREATHIVVGELTTLYRSIKPGKDFEQTRGIAEIVVKGVEKGSGPTAGEVIFVRFSNQRWVGEGEVPPHGGGHDVPAEGSAVRAYMRRGQDGSYEALLPNGLTALAEPAKGPR